jgi:transcriptional regulator with XRE-family HTH domain
VPGTPPGSVADELNLGLRLREIRKARRLSLADVANATEISPSFLSLVELGKSDITIGRLTRLAEFYKISFGDLLGGSDAGEVDLVEGRGRQLIHSPAEGIDVFLLTSNTRRTMMPMLVEFMPSAELAEYGRHDGEEFVHVLEGSLVLELEGSAPRLLVAGDSAYYSAERPHLFRNASATEPLTLMCVDSPPPTSTLYADALETTASSSTSTRTPSGMKPAT